MEIRKVARQWQHGYTTRGRQCLARLLLDRRRRHNRSSQIHSCLRHQYQLQLQRVFNPTTAAGLGIIWRPDCRIVSQPRTSHLLSGVIAPALRAKESRAVLFVSPTQNKPPSTSNERKTMADIENPAPGSLNWRLSAHPITLVTFLTFRAGRHTDLPVCVRIMRISC